MNGAVGSTTVAGAAFLRRKLAEPVALLSEFYADSLALHRWEEIVFAGWDLRSETLYEAALRNAVIAQQKLEPIRRELSALRPWPPAADRIAAFRREHGLETVVVLNLLPTGRHAASRLYARLAAKHGCPFVNFTPNDCGEGILCDVPYAGRDGKTGQTWLKSVLAPALRDRGLRVRGWFSTNLLGNEDGRVVGDPKLGAPKIRDKSRLLGEMLGYEPFHVVRIEYFPPRGDTKESFDYIEAEGFLGGLVQFRISARYPDSLLAAPMCLDLCRFIALAARRGGRGNQAWLSLYFKAPYGGGPHDFARQVEALREYLGGGVGWGHR
ncbi:MAG: inositol-3-phosphate synthase [Verrucomicrobiae bacterium]|nr:inositol-3-phosphate synthase [Verrucomicrobiae bacterium]